MVEQSRFFIASSGELEEERRKLELLIYRNNFKAVVWEDIDHSITKEKFQDRINQEHLNSSDVVIFMIKSRLGMFTYEEFEEAYKNLGKTIKKIYVYFFSVSSNDIKPDEFTKIRELKNFLQKEGKFPQNIENFQELENHFLNQKKHFSSDAKNITEQEHSIKPFNVPFSSKGDKVIGIEDKIQEVHIALEEKNKTAIGQVASFQGMGGLGKTQLAVEYAHKYKDSYDGVVWLTIDQDVDEQLVELAEKSQWVHKNIELSMKREMLKERYDSLENILFIFDNVENQEEIKKYLPKSTNNKFLITSRNAIQGFNEIELRNLDETNSIELLKKESNKEIEGKELPSVKLIVKELDGLPLALEMAGAYVGYWDCTWAEYYKLFLEKGISFLEESHINSFTKHENNIAKSLLLNDKLLKENSLLKEIMYLFAWSAKTPMSENLMTSLLEVQESDLLQALRIGVKLKFIKKSEDGYTLHRLVKEVYKAKEPLSVDFANKISTNLTNYMKNIKDEFTELKNLEKASFHAKTWAEQIEDKCIKSTLLNYSLYINFHKAEHESALAILNDLLIEFKDEGSSEIYAELLNNKGYFLLGLENPKEAKEYFQKSYEMRKYIYSNKDNSDMALSFNNMGIVLSGLGRFPEAREYQEKAFEMQKRLYVNENHQDIARSLNNLGCIFQNIGDLVEAKNYYAKAFYMNKKLYGNEDHPSIASILLNLGNIRGDINYLKESYDMQERLFGKNNQNTVIFFLNYLILLRENPMMKVKVKRMAEEFKKVVFKKELKLKLDNFLNATDTVGRGNSIRKKKRRK